MKKLFVLLLVTCLCFVAPAWATMVKATSNSGGSISPAGDVEIPAGGQAFTVTPNEGFHILSVKVDGVEKINAKDEAVAPYSYTNSYVVNAPADLIANDKDKHKIEVKFKANRYEVTATASEGGKIKPSGTKNLKHGKKQTYTIKPEKDQRILSVTVNGVLQGGVPATGKMKLPLVITEETDIEVTFTSVDDPNVVTASTTSATTTVSGVAAAGAPLIGWVTLVDHDGKKSGPVKLATDGSFSFDVSGLTPPFYMLAEGTAGFNQFHLHTIANGVSSISNINPISDLVAKTAVPQIASFLPEGAADSGVATQIPNNVIGSGAAQVALDQAITAFQTMLAPLLAQFDATIDDYLKNTFVADGTGADMLMDVVDVSVSNNGGLFNTFSVVNKATDSVIKTGDLQLDTVKTAAPIDSTLVGAVAQVKTDVEQIALAMQQFLTTVKSASLTYLTSSYDQAAYDAFYGALSQYYVSDAAFGWDNGMGLNVAIDDQWIEDFMDNRYIEGVSNLAVIEKRADGSYLLTGIGKWNGSEEPFSTPVAFIKVGDAWKITGNGYRIDPEIDAETVRMIWNDGGKTEVSGLDIDVDSYDTTVGYAIIKGPGLPAGGLRVNNEWAQGDLFPIEAGKYFVAGNNLSMEWFYVPADVSVIPFGAIYTFDVYDANNVLLQTITSRLEGRPINLASKSIAERDALFPTITNIGQSLQWAATNMFTVAPYQFTFTPAADSTLGNAEYWGSVNFGYSVLDLNNQWINNNGWVDTPMLNPAEPTFGIALPVLPSGAYLGWTEVELGTWTPDFGDIETKHVFGCSSTSCGQSYQVP